MDTVLQNTSETSGVLVIDKHAGATSHDIVNIVRRAYGLRRVGHTGTLDPIATGVLVVLVGRAAKTAEYLASDRKHYTATLRLGITTDTEDITGNITSQSANIPPYEAVSDACVSFVGKILQTPPMYSAKKAGGRRLYELAREGKIIERRPVEVEIFSLDCKPAGQPGDYSLEVVCSSGTYIRTLCADIGKKLGCGGVMAALRRTRSGDFGLDMAITTDTLLATQPEERLKLLLPVERLFSSLPRLRLPAFYSRLCRSGCEIYLSKIAVSLPVGQRVRLADESGSFFALGEVMSYPSGPAVKAIKFFEI
ncbi:MAG: tRNA pseudouridine(55) synthase TruB [Eubacteriales bacterium]|jgi:tRNA pseudouridine55 synthase